MHIHVHNKLGFVLTSQRPRGPILHDFYLPLFINDQFRTNLNSNFTNNNTNTSDHAYA